jgi:thymidine phosphorylase
VVLEIKANRSGYVSKCDAQIVGEIIRNLGGGRLTKESGINYDVGIDRLAKPGEAVQKNSGVLCRVHAADSVQAKGAIARLKTAFEISAKRPRKTPLIAEVI